MKKNNKYNYVHAPRSEIHGSRTYDILGLRLPSVTSILAKTKDQSHITRWKEKVGEKEAERIKNHSSKRGTSMHKFLEKHISGTGYDDLTEIGVQAKPMARKIIEIGFTPITEYYGNEVTLYYLGLYAGATDLVCRHNDLDTIVDFKQANRPKQKDWIEDYFLQVAAYAMAHDYLFKSEIQQAIIMVCTPDLYYQEFKIQGTELRDWKHKFLKRLNEYYELQHDEKEQLTHGTLNEELLVKFERDAKA